MHPRSREGFTLIELLVVIAIVAVLAVTVILTLNPAQLLKQARDSTRLSDLATVNGALATYQAEVKSPGMGSSSVVYVSLADSSPTCANLGLPALPAGYAYNCKAAANLRKTDGAGWIPVNLGQVSSGSPLSQLPIDPATATSSGLYYTYVPNVAGRYLLTAGLESQKVLLASAAKDGGSDPLRYEVGTDFSAFSVASGLAGNWKFDEGTGSIASDASGGGNAGTLVNGPSWVAAAGCKSGGCLSFDGSDDYVSVSVPRGVATTFSLWATATNGTPQMLFVAGPEGSGPDLWFPNGTIYWNTWDSFANPLATMPGSASDGSFHHYVLVNDPAGSAKLYYDGSLIGTAAYKSAAGSILSIGGASGYRWSGKIDEFRLYDRALSTGEVSALYLGQ